jgi:hypothetical protein
MERCWLFKNYRYGKTIFGFTGIVANGIDIYYPQYSL